jgi:KDO2-lipid IV(A) lauroyltransferase
MRETNAVPAAVESLETVSERRGRSRAVTSLLATAGLVAVSAFFCLLPRSWAHFVGRRLGGLAYFLGRRARRTAIENLRLRLGLGHAEARRVAIRSMGQAGAALVDLLRAPRLTRRVAGRDLEVTPETRALLADLQRRPTVIAGCHLGNWEFGSLCSPMIGRPYLIVVRPPRYPHVARLLAALRGWTGQKVIHRAGAGLQAHAHLAAGGCVGMVFDVSVPPQAGAVAVDFFGVPTYTTIAPAYLAARAGVPLVLAYASPLGRHRYRLVMRRIEAPEGASRRETALALTRKLSAELEAAIRETPAAWAWWLKRWSIRPEGAPGEWPSYATDERWYRPLRDE